MKLTAPFIYGLLTCILLVSAPHADHLPIWVSALCAILLCWRGYLAYSGNSLPPYGLLLTITLGSVGGILIDFHTLFGREASVTLLVLLATLKLLELRSTRDATIVIYLACFTIVTNFFYSQSIPAALFMLATLLVIMATWVHLQTGALTLREGNGEAVGYLAASPLRGLRIRLRIAAILLLQAIPLMLVLFVLFPRVQGPLWGMPQDAYASSGLDDTMSPGSLSKLSLSDAVAFRVTFSGKPPQREQMYWRGPVLWDFDGQTWTPGRTLSRRVPQLDSLSSPIDHTVTLEPHNKTWLFALEMPTRISTPADMTPDLQLRQRNPVNARLRYGVHSQLGYRVNAEEEPNQLRRALLLPRGLNPRARQLAAEWRTNVMNSADNSPLLTSPRRGEGQSLPPPLGEGRGEGKDEAVMRAALRNFSQQGFSYTLEPPPLHGFNAIDDFLFETRQGFCEHYASSFVFLMRAAGIPARVVTGYQGAEYNDLGNYYIVRQSDAHAWAEVWLQGRGWVRVDPTATIAPARVQNGLAAALPNSAELPFMAHVQLPWLHSLRFNLDVMTNQWNQWVLGYNPERQFAFLTRMGMEDVTWQKMALNMLAYVALLVGLFTLFMLRRLTVRNTDMVQALYLEFCRKLEKAGVVRTAHEGPRDFAARAIRLKPQYADAINDITARYMALRYGGQADSGALPALRRVTSTFKL